MILEWQWVATSGTTSESEWQRVTMSGTTSDNEWQRVTTSGHLTNFSFSNKRGNYHSIPWRELFKPWGRPWRGTTELRAETSP